MFTRPREAAGVAEMSVRHNLMREYKSDAPVLKLRYFGMNGFKANGLV